MCGGDGFGHVRDSCPVHDPPARGRPRLVLPRCFWRHGKPFRQHTQKVWGRCHLCFSDSGRCVARGGHVKNPASFS